MRIGNFECEKVIDESLKKYKPEIIEFFVKASTEMDSGYIVLSSPSEHGYVGIANLYESDRQVSERLSRELCGLTRTFEDYDDDDDDFWVGSRSGDCSYAQGDNIIVIQEGRIFSGEQVKSWED